MNSPPQHFPVESDVVRLVLGFLNERQRLRFLGASKTLAPWLEKRRDAARDALKRLEAQKSPILHQLLFRIKTPHDGRCYTHFVRPSPTDTGLLLVRTSWSTAMADGITYLHDFADLSFSPWASAFVCTDAPKVNPLCEDEADRRVEGDDEAYGAFGAASVRVF